MSESRLDRFRNAYLRNNALLNRGDLAAAFAWVPPEFEWHVMSDTRLDVLPPEAPPVLRGRGQVIDYFREVTTAWGWRPKGHEFEDPGDGTIVVRAAGVLRGGATGLASEVRFTQVWQLDEDGVPTSVRERVDDYFLHGTRRDDATPA